MDSNQQYYLDKYKQDLNVAYNNLHDARVDYDTFKPIAESSTTKTINAKKVFDNLAPNYIYYPDFLKSLQILYLNSKAQSDADQDVLKEKSNELSLFQKKYDDIVRKINALLIQIYEEELANDIQNLVNIPDNMVQSDELIIAKAAADKIIAEKAAADKIISDAKAVADKAIATEKAASAPKVSITESGIEVCLDSMGNQIDMSNCRPSTSSASSPSAPSAPSAAYIPTAAELVAQNINNWLKQFEVKPNTPATTTESKPITTTDSKPAVTTESKPAATNESKTTETTQSSTNNSPDATTTEKVNENPTSEDYINSFVFNVDLSKINNNQSSSSSDTSLPSNTSQTLNDLGLGGETIDGTSDTTTDVTSGTITDVSSGTTTDVNIDTKNTTDVVIDNSIIDKIEYNPIIVPDSTNNSRLVFGAAVLAVIVAYNLIKKKD